MFLCLLRRTSLVDEPLKLGTQVWGFNFKKILTLCGQTVKNKDENEFSKTTLSAEKFCRYLAVCGPLNISEIAAIWKHLNASSAKFYPARCYRFGILDFSCPSAKVRKFLTFE